MCNESRGACQQRHALQSEKGIARIEQHGGYGSGHIDGQRAADQLRQQSLDGPRNLNMARSDAGLSRNLKQSGGTRITTLVQRVTVAWNGALGLAVLAH